MEIDGRTKLSGIVGYPLDYTLSPVIQNAAFVHLGLNWCYLPLKVAEPDFAQVFRCLGALGFQGFNVTMPYKEQAMSFVDEVDSVAEMAGALNTVVMKDKTWVGYNTDVEGFLLSLKNKADYDPAKKRVFMAGAGGAARAVAVGLGRAGVSQMIIANRRIERAQKLCDLVERHFPTCRTHASALDAPLDNDIEAADLVINTTPVGLDTGLGDVPFPVNVIHDGQLVYDLVYRPSDTLLLREARKRGAKVLGGLTMLVFQAALAFSLWTSAEAPLELMEAAARRRLENK